MEIVQTLDFLEDVSRAVLKFGMKRDEAMDLGFTEIVEKAIRLSIVVRLKIAYLITKCWLRVAAGNLKKRFLRLCSLSFTTNVLLFAWSVQYAFMFKYMKVKLNGLNQKEVHDYERF